MIKIMIAKRPIPDLIIKVGASIKKEDPTRRAAPRPVAFDLMPAEFTLWALQRTVEAIAGVALHKQNFRRGLDRTGLVEGLGRFDRQAGGRPAELYRFRREQLGAGPAVGLALPLLREG